MYQEEVNILKALESEFQQRYQNFIKIDEGQFGRVYKALVVQSIERVAIKNKKVVDKGALQPGVLEYMQEEINILRSVQDNENIIKLKSCRETLDYIFLVQEYCPITLKKLNIEYFGGQIPEKKIISIMRQITNGLSRIHREKIIHRDLKPENVMFLISDDKLSKMKTQKDIIDQGVFKIIDFGLSKKLQNDEDLTNTFAGSELYTGRLKNDLIFLAPEILEEVPYGNQADMYSLGVIIYELVTICTGTLPYKSNDFQTSQLDLIKQQKASFQCFEDEELKKIVRLMLKYDPKERLNWNHLYKHPYFNFKQDQLIGLLDLQLKQN